LEDRFGRLGGSRGRCRHRLVAEPGFPPEQQASALASIVGAAVATQALEEHNAAELADPGSLHAGPVRPADDAERPAAEGDHLGHERQAIELAIAIQSAEDVLQPPHPYRLAWAESGFLLHPVP